MKRRLFLASSFAALLPASVLAAPEKSPAPKPSGVRRKKPSAAPRTTARHSILDAAHPGSSATRLPPVRAPELPAEWRFYEVAFHIESPASESTQRLWLPLPMNRDTLYQRNLGCRWQGVPKVGEFSRLPDGVLETFYGEWPARTPLQVSLTTTVATANRHFDVARRSIPPERETLVRQFLTASRQLPNEGRAYTLALEIVGRVVDPVAQARMLYDWVALHADYDPNLPNIGDGDVRALLGGLPDPTPEHWRFSGGSAVIAGLFVGLCRAIGIPARRVFGLYIAPSQTLPALGLASPDASRAAHCRAEFYVPGYSWIGVDPAGVCRAAASSELKPDDLPAIRRLLFGVWEMNWLAWNVGEDIQLPHAGPRLPFFCHPRLNRPEGDLDGTEPETFAYRIESHALDAPAAYQAAIRLGAE